MNRVDINIINKTFDDDLCVLRNLDFTVDQGEFVAIVGPSGAGKTTILNIIADIDRDYQGVVKVLSNQLNSENSVRIGFMFQQSRLMPWLSVLENINLVMKKTSESGRSGMQAATTTDRAMQLIDQVGLSGFDDKFPHQLSGGMKKRVALARAFSIDPQLLLLDEPFQSLDSPTANKFRKQLMRLWNSQKQTVLFVTHDLREALSMADRVLFLSHRPSKIILDYKVRLSRPRTIDSDCVSSLHQQILLEYPDILSGVL